MSDRMQEIVSRWHYARFPNFYKLPLVQRKAMLVLKLSEETGEVAGALNKEKNEIELSHEAMDAAIVCFQIIDQCGQDLETTFRIVMAKNQKRLEDNKTIT